MLLSVFALVCLSFCRAFTILISNFETELGRYCIFDPLKGNAKPRACYEGRKASAVIDGPDPDPEQLR